jgi:hypothetical protein
MLPSTAPGRHFNRDAAPPLILTLRERVSMGSWRATFISPLTIMISFVGRSIAFSSAAVASAQAATDPGEPLAFRANLAVKMAPFDVNGINGRLPVLLRWLREAEPDIVWSEASDHAQRRSCLG